VDAGIDRIDVFEHLVGATRKTLFAERLELCR
jgi:hypothetical protein